VEKLNKKSKANNVKPFMVKNHLWVFINAQIENPAFDSQVSLQGRHLYQCADSTEMQLLSIAAAAAAAVFSGILLQPQLIVLCHIWASTSTRFLQLSATCCSVCL
jgi:hypothetical protein